MKVRFIKTWGRIYLALKKDFNIGFLPLVSVGWNKSEPMVKFHFSNIREYWRVS